MTDGSDHLEESDFTPVEAPNRPRLLVVNPPANRIPKERPVTNLATIFGRFAEAQQQVGDQVVVLEECIQQQGDQIAEVAAQLPDMRERINWLIASYYEDDCEHKMLRDRLAKQEAGLASLTESVRALCEAQAQWKETIGQLLQALGRLPATVAAPPRWE